MFYCTHLVAIGWFVVCDFLAIFKRFPLFFCLKFAFVPSRGPSVTFAHAHQDPLEGLITISKVQLYVDIYVITTQRSFKGGYKLHKANVVLFLECISN